MATLGTVAASMKLCTSDAVKTQIKIDTSDNDTLISNLIDRASMRIEQRCARKFKLQTYTTELYNGTGSQRLYLKNAPVDSATTPTISERASGDTWTALTEVATYLVFSDPDQVGELWWLDRVWNRGTYNYRITYKAGFATTSAELPDSLTQAAVLYTEFMWAQRDSKTHLLPSISAVDGQTIQFRDPPIPTAVLNLIEPFYLDGRW